MKGNKIQFKGLNLNPMWDFSQWSEMFMKVKIKIMSTVEMP